MIRAVAFALAVGLLACVSTGPAKAQSGAGLTICNREARDDYLVAMVERYLVFLTERWESSGWYRIAPGDCRRWSRGDVNTLYLLSVTRKTETGRRVLDYGIDTIPDWHRDSAAYGMQDFYCVEEAPYRRKADRREAFKDCLTTEYKQLFNLHIFVEHNSNYTLNLK